MKRFVIFILVILIFLKRVNLKVDFMFVLVLIGMSYGVY